MRAKTRPRKAKKLKAKSRRQRKRSSESNVLELAGKPLSYGPLRHLVGFAVRHLHAYLSSGVFAVTEKEGLRPHQLTTLSLIVDNPSISQSDLSRTLGIKPSNIVPLIDELEDRRLVVRNALAHTRRRYALAATEEGRILRDRAVARIAQYEDGLLGFLTASEREMLLGLIDKIER